LSRCEFRTAAALLAGCLGLVGVESAAQQLTIEQVNSKGGTSRPSMSDGPLDTVVVQSKSRMEIQAGTAGTEATISYGDVAQRGWRVLLTAPVDKDSGEASFVNGDGLTGSTRVTLERVRYGIAAQPKDRSEDALLRPFCNTLRTMVGAKTPEPYSKLAALQDRLSKFPGLCSTDLFDAAAAIPASEIGKPDTKEFASLREKAYRSFLSGVWIYVFSGKATGGIRKYDFLSVGPTTVAKQSVEEDVWAGELAASWFSPSKDVLLGVGARYESTRKAGQPGTICPPTVTPGAPVTCLTGAVGAPVKDEKQIVFVQGRWAPERESRGFALAPRVSYDFEKGVLAVDVPVYLLQTKAGSDGSKDFVGGLRLGWNDEDRDLVASVFVGKAFDLF
jgi:hypothetical protein